MSMDAKQLGDASLKAAGLDGTWLPQGNFKESLLVCSFGHRLVHNLNVSPRHVEKNVGQVKYSVDTVTGTVTVKCPIDGEVLMQYVPVPHFK